MQTNQHITDKLLSAMDEHYPIVRDTCRVHMRTIYDGDVYIHDSEDRMCLIDSATIHTYIYRQMLADGFGFRDEAAIVKYGKLSAQVCADANWRYTRSIYRFDETLYQILIGQSLDILPMGLLLSLPERSIYIETPENPYTGTGFFAYFDRLECEYFLVLMFLPQNESELRIPIKEGLSLNRAVADILIKVPVDCGIEEKRHFVIQYRMALNLLLYLCCDNVDYSGRRKPRKYNMSHKWEEKKASTFRKIGFSIGEKLRKAKAETNVHSGMKPHVRNAHWHTYWKGKRGEQKRILNWIEPIFVNQQGDLE